MEKDIIHRSKIGFEILVPTVLILGTVMTIMILNAAWIGMIICGLVILLFTNIFTQTFYKITTDKHLFIRCGIFTTFNIDISEIKWIKKTNEVSNAPALSFDRLEINYKGGHVLVSPKDKNAFIEDLRKMNSKI